MNVKEKRAQIEATLSPEEKRVLVMKSRSKAERNYRLALQNKIELAPGKGKGLEPKPWCVCHSRSPCPLDTELDAYLEANQ